MAVKNTETIRSYVTNVSEILACLDNLREFVSDLPCPDDSGFLPNLDYGQTGDVARIREALASASSLADGMFK